MKAENVCSDCVKGDPVFYHHGPAIWPLGGAGTNILQLQRHGWKLELQTNRHEV